MQEAGYTGAVVNAKSHKGIDAKLGSEKLAVLGHYLRSGLQQLVELIDKREEEVEEYHVELTEKLLQALGGNRLAQHVEKLGLLPGLHLAHEREAVVLYLVDVARADIE